MDHPLRIIRPGTFQPENHWYPKALNATVNPLVAHFFRLSNERIIARYCHLHQTVDPDALRTLFREVPKFFYWSGADLINTTDLSGRRRMVVIETNSCPSGQKSTPLIDEQHEMGGYAVLLRGGLQQFLKGRRLIDGRLAVFYDKNAMETSGYAHAMAEIFQEDVLLVPFYNDAPNDHVRHTDRFEVRTDAGWEPIRLAFRYVTQKPWNRIPASSRTAIFNPIVACLAGGRNKLLAAKAYEFFNAEIEPLGLQIRSPRTQWEVSQGAVPFWFERYGGQLVVKSPYSNAGQGVFLLTNQAELDTFMATRFDYDSFIVQSLIGNRNWSSDTESGKLYHVGTLPDKRGETFVADIRLMIHRTAEGFRPVGMYSRRSRAPLPRDLDTDISTWDVLGTNISVKTGANTWDYDVGRLILMDRKDFNQLGLGIDDLIEAYVQTVLSTLAIDRMARRLVNSKGRFRRKHFLTLNQDQALVDEIMRDVV